jgi:hypothetical protein
MQQPKPTNITPGFFSQGNPIAPAARSLASLERDRNNLLGSTGFSDQHLFTGEILKGNQDATVLEGLQEINGLNHVFFAESNANLIQDTIKREVYTRSNRKYIIDRQDDTELLVIMRGIYLDFARYNPASIDPERLRLNKIVVDYAVPRIISEIQQYKMYLRDASSNLDLMAHPVSTNKAGTKTLRPITDVLSPFGDPFN